MNAEADQRPFPVVALADRGHALGLADQREVAVGQLGPVGGYEREPAPAELGRKPLQQPVEIALTDHTD